MRRFTISLFSIFGLLFIPFAPAMAQTFPGFPMAIYGIVTIDSVNAGTDTVVKIYNGSVAAENLIDNITVGASGAYGGGTATDGKLTIPATATGTLVFTVTETDRVDADADVETTVATASLTLTTNVTGDCPAVTALAYVAGAVCNYTIAISETLPDKPTGLNALQQSATSILLSWTEGAGADSVKVSRSTDGVTYTQIAAGQTGTTYTDSTLSAYTQYYYKLKSTNEAGDSTNFSTAAQDTTFIIAPTGVSATAASSSSITVSWTAVTGALSYKVYRAGSEITSGVTSTSYTNTGLSASTTYSYTVAAVNADGTTAQSSSASATTSGGGGGGGGGSSYTPPTPTVPGTPAPAPPPAVTTVPAPSAPASGGTVASVAQAPAISTDVGEVKLVKDPNSPKVYLVKDGKKVWIPNEKVFLASGFKWDQIQTVEGAGISTVATTTVIKSPIDNKVYEINSDGSKAWIPNESAFFAKGYNWSDVVIMPTENVLAYTEKTSLKVVKIESPSYGYLNVRSGAGTQNERISSVEHGAAYNVLEEKNGWYKIEYGAGKTGWIHGGYTTEVKSAAPPAVAPSHPAVSGKTVTINVSALNLRSSAEVGANNKIGVVRAGETYTVLEDNASGWIKIKVGETEGWVASKYTK